MESEMPTPPKSVNVRFTSAQQIEAAIDRTLARITKRNKEADRYDAIADELFRKYNEAVAGGLLESERGAYLSGARGYRERAETKRVRAQKMEQTWLPRLKGKLAAIQTMLLPNIGFTDISIKQ